MARKSIEKNISFDDVKKLYYVTMDYGKDEFGKRVKKTSTFKTKAEAKQALKKFEGDKVSGNLVMPKHITVLEWLNYWMENAVIPNRAETTVYGYRQTIDNHIGPALGSIPLQKLTPQQVQRYYTSKLNDEKNPLSSNTVRKHHDLLNTAFKFAIRQDAILKNPIERVEAPKVTNIEKAFYSPEDLATLLKLVHGTRLEIVVVLAGYLGLRREEICGLKWDCIDFEKHTIRINSAMTAAGSKVILKETKNKSSTRTLYLSNEVESILRNEQKKQKENQEAYGEDYINNSFVVKWPYGKPYRPNYLSELFTKFITDNGLPKITLHGLRHTFATIANAKGVQLFDIGKALGHSTPSTTGKIYTHLLDQNNEATIKKVAEAVETSKQ